MSSLLEPLALFGPNSPIPAILLNHLVAMAATAMPGYATASPEAQGAFRIYVQHAIAAYEPRDALEVMTAVNLVMLRSQAAEAYRIGNHPETAPAIARANRSLGVSMTRLLAQGERQLGVARAQQEKAKAPWQASKARPAEEPAARPGPAASMRPQRPDPMPSEKASTPGNPAASSFAAMLRAGTAAAALGVAADDALGRTLQPAQTPPAQEPAPAAAIAVQPDRRAVAV